MSCAICGGNIPSQENSLPTKIAKGVGLLAFWGIKKTISTTLSIPLRLVSVATQMIIKPALYGGIALAMVHVYVSPHESRRIGFKLLKKSPDAIRTVIAYTPTLFSILQKITGQLYLVSLKTISNRICENPSENPTLIEITKSLGQKVYNNISWPNHTRLVLLCKDQEKTDQLITQVEEKIKTANVFPRLIDFLTNKKSS
jgi:hypothetical protein